MKVKVCGMREPQNIAQIAALGPDLMGFIFYDGTPRCAEGLDPRALGALSPATKRVGVFVNATKEYILQTAEKYALDYVQLHGRETPALCRELQGARVAAPRPSGGARELASPQPGRAARKPLKVIKAFGIRDKSDLEKTAAYEGTCDFYVFDAKVPIHGGSGEKFDHRLLASYRGRTPYLISGGVGPEDVEAIAALIAPDTPETSATPEASRNPGRCIGVDINSRFESSPGIKKRETVGQFIKTIKKHTTMNRIDRLFQQKQSGILSVYFTAGFPHFDDTVPTITELAGQGVEMIEIGVPFSDPMADGPVIQQSSTVALNNGMTLRKLFAQLEGIRAKVDIPLIMMGYLNPIMQYGIEAFCRSCAEKGIDGMIIPDLPLADYIRDFRPLMEKYGLHCIMLITPETSEERIRMIDKHTSGFIYMVSTASTTGAKDSFDKKTLAYFERVNAMNLHNPRMIGFGISNRETFAAAAKYAAGGIIGSRFIRLLAECGSIPAAVAKLVETVR